MSTTAAARGTVMHSEIEKFLSKGGADAGAKDLLVEGGNAGNELLQSMSGVINSIALHDNRSHTHNKQQHYPTTSQPHNKLTPASHMPRVTPWCKPKHPAHSPSHSRPNRSWLIESAVYSAENAFAGTCDWIGELDGVPTLCDWKSSRLPKSSRASLGTYPLQIAAYWGALREMYAPSSLAIKPFIRVNLMRLPGTVGALRM